MSRIYRVAFAGLRHNHIFTLARMVRENPCTELAGAWEEDAAAAAAGKEQIAAPFYDSYDELLADPTVDIVAVGDYYGIRGNRIIRALRAGKHVISDKPLCTSLDELQEIERLCREKGLVLSCMLSLRYDPAIRLARDIIMSGQLGEIRNLMFTGQHPLLEGERAKWYYEAGKHGGTFNDIAIHGVDAVRFITGLEFGPALCARTWNSFAVNTPAFPDSAQYMGKLENGAGIMADVSYAAPAPSGYSLPTYWRFTFWGAKGWLETTYHGRDVHIALSGDTAARTLPVPAVEGDYLNEMLCEISGGDVMFDTAGVIASARAVLTIQAYADKYGKEM